LLSAAGTASGPVSGNPPRSNRLKPGVGQFLDRQVAMINGEGLAVGVVDRLARRGEIVLLCLAEQLVSDPPAKARRCAARC
jgi:hypothetical protein